MLTVLADIRFVVVCENCDAYFGIGLVNIPAGTVGILGSVDESYSEYGVWFNLPDAIFVHIPDKYCEVSKCPIQVQLLDAVSDR